MKKSLRRVAVFLFVALTVIGVLYFIKSAASDCPARHDGFRIGDVILLAGC